MNEYKENIIVQKSNSFALEIVKLYKQLSGQKEYVLSKQIAHISVQTHLIPSMQIVSLFSEHP